VARDNRAPGALRAYTAGALRVAGAGENPKWTTVERRGLKKSFLNRDARRTIAGQPVARKSETARGYIYRNIRRARPRLYFIFRFKRRETDN